MTTPCPASPATSAWTPTSPSPTAGPAPCPPCSTAWPTSATPPRCPATARPTSPPSSPTATSSPGATRSGSPTPPGNPTPSSPAAGLPTGPGCGTPKLPGYLELAAHHHPGLRVDITYVTPPMVPDPVPLPTGSRYSHLTWNDALALVDQVWAGSTEEVAQDRCPDRLDGCRPGTACQRVADTAAVPAHHTAHRARKRLVYRGQIAGAPDRGRRNPTRPGHRPAGPGGPARSPHPAPRRLCRRPRAGPRPTVAVARRH